jgi:hypothetical protein
MSLARLSRDQGKMQQARELLAANVLQGVVRILRAYSGRKNQLVSNEPVDEASALPAAMKSPGHLGPPLPLGVQNVTRVIPPPNDQRDNDNHSHRTGD